MAWRRPGDKPFSEPMMISLLTHICVTRPQWVKEGANIMVAMHVINIAALAHLYAVWYALTLITCYISIYLIREYSVINVEIGRIYKKRSGFPFPAAGEFSTSPFWSMSIDKEIRWVLFAPSHSRHYLCAGHILSALIYHHMGYSTEGWCHNKTDHLFVVLYDNRKSPGADLFRKFIEWSSKWLGEVSGRLMMTGYIEFIDIYIYILWEIQKVRSSRDIFLGTLSSLHFLRLNHCLYFLSRHTTHEVIDGLDLRGVAQVHTPEVQFN